MPPRVAPGEDDLEWATTGGNRCDPFAACTSVSAGKSAGAQHWRVSAAFFSLLFFGMVIYLSINAYNTTQASTQN